VLDRTPSEWAARASAGRQLTQQGLDLDLEPATRRHGAEPLEELAIDPCDLAE
jgi:hypothetical protein